MGLEGVQNVVVPYDDDRIDDDDHLIRRIDYLHHVVEDKNDGRYRISTKAFSQSSTPPGGMSVDIEKLIVARGEKPCDYVISPPHIGAVYFRAGDAREADLQIGVTPLPHNPCHGDVWNKSGSNNFTRRQKVALLEMAKWLVEIGGVHLQSVDQA